MVSDPHNNPYVIIPRKEYIVCRSRPGREPEYGRVFGAISRLAARRYAAERFGRLLWEIEGWEIGEYHDRFGTFPRGLESGAIIDWAPLPLIGERLFQSALDGGCIGMHTVARSREYVVRRQGFPWKRVEAPSTESAAWYAAECYDFMGAHELIDEITVWPAARYFALHGELPEDLEDEDEM